MKQSTPCNNSAVFLSPDTTFLTCNYSSSPFVRLSPTTRQSPLSISWRRPRQKEKKCGLGIAGEGEGENVSWKPHPEVINVSRLFLHFPCFPFLFSSFSSRVRQWEVYLCPPPQNFASQTTIQSSRGPVQSGPRPSDGLATSDWTGSH